MNQKRLGATADLAKAVERTSPEQLSRTAMEQAPRSLQRAAADLAKAAELLPAGHPSRAAMERRVAILQEELALRRKWGVGLR